MHALTPQGVRGHIWGMEICRRIHFLRKIFANWRWVGALIAVLSGIFPVIRDYLLPPDWQERVMLWKWVPDWPWWGWVILSLSVIIVLLFEGAYQIYRRQEEKMRPKLKIICANYRFEEDNKNYVAYIIVKNLSSAPVNGTSVKICNVYNKDGEKVDIQIMPFRLFAEPHRHMVGYSQATSFSLAANESVEVAIAKARSENRSFELCFVRPEIASIGSPITLKFSEAPYKLELSIHSSDGGDPVRALYSLDVKQEPEHVPTFIPILAALENRNGNHVSQ